MRSCSAFAVSESALLFDVSRVALTSGLGVGSVASFSVYSENVLKCCTKIGGYTP